MEYDIIRSKRNTLAMQIKLNKLIIRAPMYITDDEINAFIEKNKTWIEKHFKKSIEQQEVAASVKKLSVDEIKNLTDKALQVIPKRVNFYASLIGVTYGRISIRSQKTRWGSCSSKGNLNFNCLLMLAPAEVLDSVIVHELCHRKEMNHSERFYTEVLRIFPEYPKWNKWLKVNGNNLMYKIER